MFDDPRGQLKWLEEELLAEEEDLPEEWDGEEWEDGDELGPGYNHAVDFHRTMYADLDYGGRDETEPKPRKKGIKGLVFLAFLEILGILLIIGWWLRWLI